MNARVSTAAVLSALVWASIASSQTVQQKLDLTREAVESQRRLLVSGSLRLGDAEAKPSGRSTTTTRRSAGPSTRGRTSSSPTSSRRRGA
ncbi:MAG: hypothetical protein U0599_27660 [Vicinamibacteria bacterium]